MTIIIKPRRNYGYLGIGVMALVLAMEVNNMLSTQGTFSDVLWGSIAGFVAGFLIVVVSFRKKLAITADQLIINNGLIEKSIYPEDAKEVSFEKGKVCINLKSGEQYYFSIEEHEIGMIKQALDAMISS